MLTCLKEIFRDHSEYAIAGFNVFGYEDAAPVLKAAEELNEPVALMVNRVAQAHMPLPVFAPMLLELARRASVPVSVHLDHAVDQKIIEEALKAGFTSVMFDGSCLPVEENIRRTKQVVEMARACGASVEAEIGAVAYSGPDAEKNTVYTTPDAARLFFESTRVDCLAVSVGTVHRMTTQTAHIQYDRLCEIHRAVDVPLVIHGSTGLPNEDLARLSHCGVSKINIGTCLRMAFGRSMREYMAEHPNEFDRITIFQYPMEKVYEAAREKLLAIRK